MGVAGQGARDAGRAGKGDVRLPGGAGGLHPDASTRCECPEKAGYLQVMPAGRVRAGSRGGSLPRDEEAVTPFLGVDLDRPIGDLSRAVDGGAEEQRALVQLARSPSDAMPAWKRGLDLVVASLLLVLLAPLLLLLAAFVRIVSPGPALFRQERIGLRGQPFELIKLRSMHLRADTEGHRRYLEELRTSDRPMIKMDAGQDGRLIRFGRLIRASALDELPQLINVVRGDMSLVGPRPAIPYEYRTYAPWQRLRFCAVPGMTGLWQVKGKNHTTFSEMIRWDTRYALTKSPGLDLLILVRTPGVLVGQVVELVRKKKGERREKPD